MAEPIEFEDDKPLDPKVENIRRRMVRLLAISIGSMLIGLLAVFGAIIYKINQPGEAESAGTPNAVSSDATKTVSASIKLPEGAQLIASNLDGNRILLTLKLADGKHQLRVFDTTSGRVVTILDLGI